MWEDQSVVVNFATSAETEDMPWDQRSGDWPEFIDGAAYYELRTNFGNGPVEWAELRMTPAQALAENKAIAWLDADLRWVARSAQRQEEINEAAFDQICERQAHAEGLL